MDLEELNTNKIFNSIEIEFFKILEEQPVFTTGRFYWGAKIIREIFKEVRKNGKGGKAIG
jgi:hypothetical protein